MSAGIISLIGGVVAAVTTYWFTKKREREAEWRQQKLVYYKIFVESLSGVVEGDSTPEGHQAFAKATNNLLLFAPQHVIEAVNAFRDEIRISNPSRTQEHHDKLLTALFLAIRQDIGVIPHDNPSTFSPILWASGISRDNP